MLTDHIWLVAIPPYSTNTDKEKFTSLFIEHTDTKYSGNVQTYWYYLAQYCPTVLFSQITYKLHFKECKVLNVCTSSDTKLQN